MDIAEWENRVPAAFKEDSLWKMVGYRLSLFLADVSWDDITKLMQDRRTFGVSDQLYRAIGSISANLAEGYSRGTGKDRARFYEYALGSARESRDWYYKARHILGEDIVAQRFDLPSNIIRLLLTMIPQQRQQILKEEPEPYLVASELDF
ncbi:MAG TPA: four helix bundle protein [Anaerolineae bacterium]|nr:four helix bundle protein [Anaerolineae bacterium]HQI83893.1 four helix bundle protein [Anaerolineae bacterium]